MAAVGTADAVDVFNSHTPETSVVADRKSEKESTATTEPQALDDSIVPTTRVQFVVILIALVLAIFCVALDNTIIVTAIPRITDDYQTLSDVGW